MFAHAISLITPFTQPVIISKRLADGTVEAGCATFVIVNRDGWILTAGHLFQDLFLADQHKTEQTAYFAETQRINSEPKLTSKQKTKQIARFPKTPAIKGI
jgi:polynucleotide 5'-kinase involved in rRNA processing